MQEMGSRENLNGFHQEKNYYHRKIELYLKSQKFLYLTSRNKITCQIKVIEIKATKQRNYSHIAK